MGLDWLEADVTTDSTDITTTQPGGRVHGVHLVGSVPLSDSEAVFREAATRLGGHLRRLPDGETGVRTNWIRWQWPLLLKVPQLEAADSVTPSPWGPQLQLAAGASVDEVVLPELGYRAAALESYDMFRRLKSEGVIPPEVRFQVCLPTPLAVVHIRVVPRDQEAIEAVYEQALLAELDDLLEAIPPHELAIQWDTAVEFALLEGMLDSFIDDPMRSICERLVRLGNHVPAEVELGYHLCYGDVAHRHFKEPEDMTKLVDVANGVLSGLDRALDWLHMPVPRNRSDDSYYAPLSDLKLGSSTECYLGLVHLTDGLDGTAERITTARRHLPEFGVATECGLGRRDPETIPALLDLHADVCSDAS